MQKAGSQRVNACMLILLLLNGIIERGEQVCYCFLFFGCGELYFMGNEKTNKFYFRNIPVLLALSLVLAAS